jgi:hypothetical protein
MFERDVQSSLDAYLRAEMSENIPSIDSTLANYEEDYRL